MYKLFKSTLNQTVIVKTNQDGSIISFFENSDSLYYQEYLKWLAEGNTPEPADE